MSLCDGRALFANDKEVARRRSGAASRDSDEVIHEKRRQACRRINQCFLITTPSFFPQDTAGYL